LFSEFSYLRTGFKFNGKVNKITEDQIKNSKPKTTRCLSVLGFTAMANIKDHQFLGDSIRAVVAKPGDEVTFKTTYTISIIMPQYDGV